MAEAYKKINELTEMLAVDINESTKMVVSTGVGGVSKNLNVSDLVANNLSSSSEHRALSAAMGKKLSEEKAPLSNPQFTGSVGGVTKGMVGLGNVDNTSDINKPISQAAQSALNSKAPINSPRFTGKVYVPSPNGDDASFQAARQGTLDDRVPHPTSSTANKYLRSSDDGTAFWDDINNLNGTQYVMVYGVGTPEDNARELQAAYNAAKKMPRYTGEFAAGGTIDTIYTGQTIGLNQGGQYRWLVALKEVTSAREYYGTVPGEFAEITPEQAKSVRTTVIVAPGEYSFGASAFTVNTLGINIVSLTGNSDVVISSTEKSSGNMYTYGIKVTADNVFVKGIDCKTNTFYISNILGNLICEYCIGANFSFGGDGAVVSGTFNYCTAGDYSFSFKGSASGTFNHCIGGSGSFGGYDGTASGTFNNCIAGQGSFASFGAITGELINCKLTVGTFRTPTGEGRIYNCIDGGGYLINNPLPVLSDNAAAAGLATGVLYRTAAGALMVKY